jgi:hypothetical protein
MISDAPIPKVVSQFHGQMLMNSWNSLYLNAHFIISPVHASKLVRMKCRPAIHFPSLVLDKVGTSMNMFEHDEGRRA